MDTPSVEFLNAYHAAGLTGWGPWATGCPYCARYICRNRTTLRYAMHNLGHPQDLGRIPSLVGWRCPASNLTRAEAVRRLGLTG